MAPMFAHVKNGKYCTPLGPGVARFAELGAVPPDTRVENGKFCVPWPNSWLPRFDYRQAEIHQGREIELRIYPVTGGLPLLCDVLRLPIEQRTQLGLESSTHDERLIFGWLQNAAVIEEPDPDGYIRFFLGASEVAEGHPFLCLTAGQVPDVVGDVAQDPRVP